MPKNKAFINIVLVLFVLFLGYTACDAPAPEQEETSEEIIKTPYKFEDERVRVADSLRSERKYAEAITEYEVASASFEAEENWEGVVYTLDRIGYSYRRWKKDSMSRETFKKAIAFSKAELGSGSLLTSRTFLDEGVRRHFLGDWKMAAKMVDTAFTIYQKSQFYDSTLLESIIDYKYYTYYYSQVSSDTAIKYLDLRKFLKTQKGEITQPELFILYRDYASIYRQKGDYQKALAYSQEAYKIGLANKSKVRELDLLTVLFSLAASYYELGDLENSTFVGQQLLQDAIDLWGPKDIRLGGYYNILATNLNLKGDFNAASVEFQKAVDLHERNEVYNEQYFTYLSNLGWSFHLLEDYEKANFYLKKSLESRKKAFGLATAGVAEAYDFLGRHSEGLRRYDEALSYYDSAMRSYLPSYDSEVLDVPKKNGFDVSYRAIKSIKSKVIQFNRLFDESNNNVKNLQATLKYSDFIHEILTRNRQTFEASEGKLFISKDFKDFYSASIEASYLLYQNSPDKDQRKESIKQAILQMARSKANLFLEQSGEFDEVRSDQVPQHLRINYFNLVNRIEELDGLLNRLTKELATSDSIRFFNAERMVLNNQLSSLRDSVRTILSSDSKIDEFDANRIFDNIKGFLKRKKGTNALIEYFVSDDYIYYSSLSANSESLNRIPLDSVFRNSFNSFLEEISSKPDYSITRNSESYAKSVSSYVKSSSLIYQKLLEPALEQFESEVKSLIIIPDEELSKLPFEALVSNSNENNSYFNLNYLIKEYEISYSLSSKLLTNQSKQSKTNNKLLGFGYTGESLVELRSSLGDLPGTTDEINYLRSNIPGDYFLGVKGTKSAFLEKASDYKVIHLAIHGEADNNDRYESRLIFNGTVDNILRTRDLYMANLNARLAILSACESGVGELNSGEGTFSIARGFALTGIPSVVMSLWKVNDKTSADLMVDFHENLAISQNISYSLRKSKTDYLIDSDEFTSHPYYWSAFVLLGDDRSLDDSNDLWKIILASTVILVLGLTVVIKKRKPVKNRPS